MPRIVFPLLRYSVNEKGPVPILVTYLRGDAQTWWSQIGKDQIGLTASFAAFRDLFLALFVKPGDSRKARQELAGTECYEC